MIFNSLSPARAWRGWGPGLSWAWASRTTRGKTVQARRLIRGKNIIGVSAVGRGDVQTTLLLLLPGDLQHRLVLAQNVHGQVIGVLVAPAPFEFHGHAGRNLYLLQRQNQER